MSRETFHDSLENCLASKYFFQFCFKFLSSQILCYDLSRRINQKVLGYCPGLNDYYGGATLTGKGKVSADATYHVFSLTRDMIVNNQNIRHDLGSELYLVLNYKVVKEASLQLGWCPYFVSNTTRHLKKADNHTRFPQYAYMMLTIKPQFYKTPEVLSSEK